MSDKEKRTKHGKHGWHYLSVYKETPNTNGKTTKGYSLCEVYLDKDGKLEYWTESHQMSSYGKSADELIEDLEMMLTDAKMWKSEDFESLVSGMKFKKNKKQQ